MGKVAILRDKFSTHKKRGSYGTPFYAGIGRLFVQGDGSGNLFTIHTHPYMVQSIGLI